MASDVVSSFFSISTIYKYLIYFRIDLFVENLEHDIDGAHDDHDSGENKNVELFKDEDDTNDCHEDAKVEIQKKKMVWNIIRRRYKVK